MDGNGVVLNKKRDIGKELRKKRHAARLSLQNVADLMFWSLSKVSKIENNHQDISALDYFHLTEILEARKVASFFINIDNKPVSILPK